MKTRSFVLSTLSAALFALLLNTGCDQTDGGPATDASNVARPLDATFDDVPPRPPQQMDASFLRDGSPDSADLDATRQEDSGTDQDGSRPLPDQGPMVPDAGALPDRGLPPLPDMAIRMDASNPSDLGAQGSQDARRPDQGNDRDAAGSENPPWIYVDCERACCPGYTWRRPGGFWSDLAGHTPDWRPTPEAPCIFGLRRDDCDRVTGYTLGRDECRPDACEGCRLNLNEFRRNFGFAYDARGHLTRESLSVQRHIDWSDDTHIQHRYDERGLRSSTSGLYLPENDAARSLYLRYTHDDSGRLVREEAVHDRFHDFEPIPWVPTRISTFNYRVGGVEENLDSNGDGQVDEVIFHPLPRP